MTELAVFPSTSASGVAPRTRIKLCGLSRVDDVLPPPRRRRRDRPRVLPEQPARVSIAQAAELARAAPPFVSVVGLFVNATEAEIDAVVRDVPLTMLQFHGDETPQQCEALGRAARLPWLRAVRVGPRRSRPIW
jgi:phosphoribosylanthranilate isomerase